MAGRLPPVLPSLGAHRGEIEEGPIVPKPNVSERTSLAALDSLPIASDLTRARVEGTGIGGAPLGLFGAPRLKAPRKRVASSGAPDHGAVKQVGRAPTAVAGAWAALTHAQSGRAGASQQLRAPAAAAPMGPTLKLTAIPVARRVFDPAITAEWPAVASMRAIARVLERATRRKP